MVQPEEIYNEFEIKNNYILNIQVCKVVTFLVFITKMHCNFSAQSTCSQAARQIYGYLQSCTKSTARTTFFIYLLECKKCHIQYVGKGATDLNLKLNNHHKDVYKADAILAPRYFGMKDDIFNRDTSFIINEQTRKNPSRRETKKKLLKQREKFWVMKLETLKPKRLNQEQIK